MRYLIGAMRGRSEGDWYHSEHRQMLETRCDATNSITTVAKDNYVIEVYDDTTIR
jgi:hypothetical protein